MDAWVIVSLLVTAALPIALVVSFVRGARKDQRRAERYFSS